MVYGKSCGLLVVGFELRHHQSHRRKWRGNHMANEEQFGILKQGVAAWNAWFRDGGKSVQVDLSGANLSGTDLRDAILIGANLSEAVLIKADLSGANLNEANLSGGHLSEAILSRTDLNKANLNGANLSYTNIGAADLSGANLRDAHLINADLSEAELSGANLSGAYLAEDGSGSNPSSHEVQGYTNQFGTSVAPHYQTNPNNTQMDNYGSRGNYNPNNGNIGTRSPHW
jgi:uncharacterized protein YjbI with pentapeptide repeats